MQKNICTLCGGQNIELFFENKQREFHRCGDCDLIFVPKQYFLSVNEEKEQYDFHQNSFENRGYIEFLNQLCLPTQKFINPNANGLDFGSGPMPVLSQMFELSGFNMDIYDYFYATDIVVFEKKYDFITSTEVFEHLHNPLDEVKKLWNCLEVGGVLAIMTGMTQHISDFKNWHYIRDLTHICFFSDKTFRFIASLLGGEIIFEENNVTILKKIKI